MKYIKIIMVLWALLALIPLGIKAQNTMQINIKATVLDSDRNPIGAAVIKNDKDVSRTISNNTGEFEISVPVNSTLIISAKGYVTREIPATASIKEVELISDRSDEYVQVAFRHVKKDDLLGGVSSVNVDELMQKNYTTYSLDGMEALVGGYHGNMWGMNEYLVLVDGVPRDASNVLPTEIDDISFLKGASAVALYGSRAAKGVIYIKTKRGVEGKQKINIRANAGVFVPKSYPKYVGSAEYMSLYNEARMNDGLEELYDAETIYNYASGSNPYRYPDVDYYSSDYLKEAYSRYDVTGEIFGGNERARYYTNFGFNDVGSLLDFGEAKEHSGSQRFNIRGNIDVDLNQYITCAVDASAVFYTGKGTNADYWGGAATLRPHRFAPLIPIDMIESDDEASMVYVNNSSHLIDGKYLLGGTQLDQTNPIASIYAGGNNKYNSRQFQFNTSVNADLRNVLEGLTFKSMIAIDYSTIYSLAYNNSYATYQAGWNNYAGIDQISSLTKYGNDEKSGNQNVSGSWYRQTMAFSGQLNYLNTFNDVHNVSAMLIASGYQQSQSEEYHKVNNVNAGIQFGYNFKQKYYFDFSGAVIHSARLPENNRIAFSPTASLGWRISEENFMESVSAVDNLKLTVSAGILNTDLDIDDYYLYQGYYTYTDASWYSWRDGGLVHTFDRRRGDNEELDYPKREEISIGLEASLFDKMITVNGSFFTSQITGNIVQPSILYPSYFLNYWPDYSDLPYVNYNEDTRTGFDFYLGFNKNIGKIDWTLGVSGTYYDTNASKRAEDNEYAYQNRAGKPIDGIWGLESNGFFMSEDDIASSASQTFGEVQPGDIKYIDQNNDGVIDTKDEVYLGKAGWSGAPFTLGVNLSAKWKNLTVFALATGRFGAYSLKNNSYYWVDGDDKYSEIVRNRWTEETKDIATYPRLTTNNSDNNYRSSDFWMYSTNRFDIAKVQISYDLPKHILQNTFVSELGMYVSGSNLLTISPERETLELNVGSAPQTRFYNLGIKAVF